MGRLAGKVAIVTGAAQGLGRAIGRAYLTEGAAVAIVDVNAEELKNSERELRTAGDQVVSHVTDLTDRAAVRNMVQAVSKRFGPVDILVNNAVWAKYQPLNEVNEDVFDRMLAIGLKGLLWVTQAVAPAMIERNRGSIINLSSISALVGMAYSPVYAAVKGGVDGLTRALAVDLGQNGIRVNAISPSAIPSPMSQRILDEGAWEGRRRRTPLGRIGQPSDIAHAAVFLGSDDSSFITGEIVRVDGGYCIGGAIPGVDVARR
jgi:NAD(P)-dependent dehydrogenase (short-subunit alcohol dehydrogenase family)